MKRTTTLDVFVDGPVARAARGTGDAAVRRRFLEPLRAAGELLDAIVVSKNPFEAPLGIDACKEINALLTQARNEKVSLTEENAPWVHDFLQRYSKLRHVLSTLEHRRLKIGDADGLYVWSTGAVLPYKDASHSARQSG